MKTKTDFSRQGWFKGKIAVATDNGTHVTGHIGRCRAFMIFEIDGDNIIHTEMRENVFTHHRMPGHEPNNGEHHHGEDHEMHSHTGLINGLRDCGYLISQGGGWRVVEDLRNNNIEPLFTDVEQMDEVVNKFIKGELKNIEGLVCNGK